MVIKQFEWGARMQKSTKIVCCFDVNRNGHYIASGGVVQLFTHEKRTIIKKKGKIIIKKSNKIINYILIPAKTRLTPSFKINIHLID
jgi:hypothetical protein